MPETSRILHRLVGCALSLAAMFSFSACTAQPAAPAVTTKAEPVDVDFVRQRVIAWYPIGWSVRDASRRNVDRDLEKIGWRGFVSDVVKPVLDRHGITRVLLHNPFGTLPGEPMQFDQYLSAQAAGLDWLTDGFVPAWKPLTDSGVEVIGYMGNPHLDPESQKVIKNQGEKIFYKRAWAAIAPLRKAGMSIGYDAAVITDKDSATYRFAKMMQAKGLKVYVEAVPKANKPWWFDFPVIVREDTWQKTRVNPEFASRAQLESEIIRIGRVPGAWIRGRAPDEWPEKICRVIAEGDSVVIEDFLLNKPARNLDSLTTCVNQYRAAHSG